MYCSKCNSQIPDAAKFCPQCGETIVPKNDTYTPVPLKPPAKTKQSKADKVKKVFMWLIIAVSVALVIILFAFINNYNQTTMQEKEAEQEARSAMYSEYGTYTDMEVERTGKNNFSVKCKVEKSGELYSYSGNVSFNLYDNGTEEWDASSWRDTVTYKFAQNDNFYYVGLRGGNIGYLLKFTSINESSATLKIYSYSMGHYGGPDSFDQDTETISLHYDDENQCFTFNWAGDWRLYPDRLERDVGEKMSAYPKVEFKEKSPVDPNNYWWYSRARNS